LEPARSFIELVDEFKATAKFAEQAEKPVMAPAAGDFSVRRPSVRGQSGSAGSMFLAVAFDLILTNSA
jgi:hypothetical protein